MADIEAVLTRYVSRRAGGRAARAKQRVQQTAHVYRSAVEVLCRFGNTSHEFWATVDVSNTVSLLLSGGAGCLLWAAADLVHPLLQPLARQAAPLPACPPCPRLPSPRSSPPQMLERCITGLMDEFEGEQDYYFAKRQYGEFLLPALQGVGRGFATGFYVGHQACVVSSRERWQTCYC